MLINCSKCGPKDESNFGRRRGKFQPFCKQCNREYGRQHYKDNKGYYHERNKKQKMALRQFIVEFKKDKPCMDCGVLYPSYVMDFDHQGDKEFDIGSAQSQSYGIEKVKKEIEKCELVCANCHRIRTHKK